MKEYTHNWKESNHFATPSLSNVGNDPCVVPVDGVVLFNGVIASPIIIINLIGTTRGSFPTLMKNVAILRDKHPLITAH